MCGKNSFLMIHLDSIENINGIFNKFTNKKITRCIFIKAYLFLYKVVIFPHVISMIYVLLCKNSTYIYLFLND